MLLERIAKNGFTIIAVRFNNTGVSSLRMAFVPTHEGAN
jgi:hypothetical protein